MHELSLCRTIIDIIHDHTKEKKINRIKKITLEIGQLAAVDESALRFGFEAISDGSIAQGAILDILIIEGQAFCDRCQKTVPLKRYYDACSSCGQFTLTVTQGEELRIKFMEVE